MAMVNGVGVRPDHTRRGLFTRLMRTQLTDCAERGDVFASLHASEAVIYGRAGYGVATREKNLRVHRLRAKPRPELPSAGRLRLLTPDEAVSELDPLYRRIAPHRTGMMTRPDLWWAYFNRKHLSGDGAYLVAVHSGPDGDDGFVVYRVEEKETGTYLGVRDLQAASTSALIGLWRYLLGIDLVTEIRAYGRPVDEPVEAMLVDSRACEVTDLCDALWLRLVDVPGALAARTYRGGEPVVVEVTDPVLPANSGRYLIGPDGARRTNAAAGLVLDVSTLARTYLGDQQVSTLAELGQVHVLDPDAPARFDTLFATARPPWGGTHF